MISPSSSTASSAPATSAKVVLGRSLLSGLALDLPKLMTLEPPPIWFMKKNSSPRMSTIGSRETSIVTRNDCRGTFTS